MSAAAEPASVATVDGEVFAEGEVTAAVAPAFCAALVAAARAAPAGPLMVDMGALELEDGVTVARVVTALRAAREGRPSLTLREAPQMLAHTLYKVGMLGGDLRLEAPRSEQGFGAS